MRDHGCFNGDSFEIRYFEGDLPRSGGEVAAIVATAVALALLIALVPGCLGQFLCPNFQQLVEGFLYAASYQLFDLILDYFLIKLYNLFRHGLLSPFRMVCRNFILPEICKPCLFYLLFNLRNLFYLIYRTEPPA